MGPRKREAPKDADKLRKITETKERRMRKKFQWKYITIKDMKDRMDLRR